MKSQSLVSACSLKGLTFAYPGDTPVLRDLSWQLPAGAFALITGATGSGKSTLMRLLKPELAPVGHRRGEISILGRLSEEWTQLQSAAQIGFVAQDPETQIVCDTVDHELAFGLENLGMPAEQMRRRVAEVAQFLGIASLMRKKTSELSGGELQTVVLASVLAGLPRLLLLDEPTSQLDPVAEKNFLHELFRANRELGISVIVATHEVETCLAYASCSFELKDGHLLDVTERIRTDASGGVYPACEFVPDHASPAHIPTHVSSHILCHIDDVWLRYGRTDPWVLRGMELKVARGSIHALIGGNGSGKSTVLRLIAGTRKPQRGRIQNDAQACQALLPQDPKALFVCDSVGEELREWQHSAGYSSADIEKAQRRAGLVGFVERNPYDLSGGQQQALALAKLVLTRPKLMLLDEPTKGLDPASRVEVACELARLVEAGTTIVVATHDLSFVSRIADQVSLLFDGTIACTLPCAEFFSEDTFYRPISDGFMRLFDARSSDAWLRGEERSCD